MGLIEAVSRSLVDKMADQLLLRLMRDPYAANLWEIISTTMKVTPRELMEIVLRAEKGKPLGRPFGTVYHFSPWQELLFNPVALVRLPTVDEKSVETKVTLGPKAKRPLELAIPIIITGMSYG
ncbi:MAG: FMN-binding glutamate synthase family protein, partial [Firmicutes bacterium]|nr:FMN-binding glutamate synthase family protein [Bacillota bacterium]